MNDIVLLVGNDGGILDANPAALEAYGHSIDEIRRLTVTDISEPPGRNDMSDRLREAVTTGMRFETRQLRASGEFFLAEVHATPVDVGGEMATLAMIKQTTQRFRSGVYALLDGEIRTLVERSLNLEECLRDVVGAIKERTGSDAVGIRLQEGEDFPYAAQDGFSTLHLRAENSLIERDAIGGVCRDEFGDVSLACACGLVLSGRNDPILTPGGSVWTDDSAATVELLGDADPRFNPRNLCVLEGFASIAIVPIPTRGHIIGLIHLATVRKGFYSLESTEELETIATHFGEALTRFL